MSWFSGVTDAVSNAASAVGDTFMAAADAGAEAAAWAAETASDAAVAAAENAAEAASWAAETATNAAKAAAESAAEAAALTAQKAKEAANATVDTAKYMAEKGVDAAKWTAQKARQAATAAGNAAVSIFNKAKDAFNKGVAATSKAACALKNAVITNYLNATLPNGKQTKNMSCGELALQEEEFNNIEVRAKLAGAVYDDSGMPASERDLPDGWLQASPDQLKEMDLIEDDGNNLTEIEDSNFKSEVFVNEEGKVIVAFKGTSMTSGEDWSENAQQSLGNESAYYSQSMLIAAKLNTTSPGNVEYTGHSLGGGLASAAAESYGEPATTFNAAGLHSNTVPPFERKENDPEIRAVYVSGEALSGAQDYSPLPNARGRRILLAPDNTATVRAAEAVGAVGGAFVAGPSGMYAGSRVTKGLQLHRMPSVNNALKKVQDNIESMQKHKGCK